jgi:hypothetical protein
MVGSTQEDMSIVPCNGGWNDHMKSIVNRESPLPKQHPRLRSLVPTTRMVAQGRVGGGNAQKVPWKEDFQYIKYFYKFLSPPFSFQNNSVGNLTRNSSGVLLCKKFWRILWPRTHPLAITNSQKFQVPKIKCLLFEISIPRIHQNFKQKSPHFFLHIHQVGNQKPYLKDV